MKAQHETEMNCLIVSQSKIQRDKALLEKEWYQELIPEQKV